MNFLIDTDWTIDYLNGARYVRDRLNDLGISDLGISVVSVAELYEGVLYSRSMEDDHAALSLFLENEVTALGIDMENMQNIRTRAWEAQKTGANDRRYGFAYRINVPASQPYSTI